MRSGIPANWRQTFSFHLAATLVSEGFEFAELLIEFQIEMLAPCPKAIDDEFSAGPGQPLPAPSGRDPAVLQKLDDLM